MAITLPNSSLSPVINPASWGASIQQGSQVLLTVNGTPVGWVQRVEQSDSYNAEPFYAIGQIEPVEIQPLQFQGQLTLTGGRLYVASWLGNLFQPAGNILTSGALNVVVYNRVTQTPDIIYVGFVVTTYNATYQNNAYTIQTMTGLYRTIQ